MAPGRQISSVEMMRGIAAFMVAYFHIACGNPQFLGTDSFFFQIGQYGWAGVEIFFVISGFIITYAMHHGGYTLARAHKFLAKRLTRLEPPYIASIVLVVVLLYVSTLSPYYRGEPFDPDWGNVLGHIGYVNAFTGDTWLQPVYWTLAVEFEFYILLALLFPLLVHKRKAVSWATVVGLGALSFIPTGHDHVFQYLSYFMMGIVLSLYTIGHYGKTEFMSLFLAAAVLCFYTQDPVLVCLALVTVGVIMFRPPVPAPLRWLGKISYSLYLLHVPIGGRIINISEVLVHNHYARIALVFAALAISLLCSYLFYKWVERPFQKLSKNISYK